MGSNSDQTFFGSDDAVVSVCGACSDPLSWTWLEDTGKIIAANEQACEFFFSSFECCLLCAKGTFL